MVGKGPRDFVSLDEEPDTEYEPSEGPIGLRERERVEMKR